jgi:hypothetical protein
MFDIEKLCGEIREAAMSLESVLCTDGSTPTTSDISAINDVDQIVHGIRDKVMAIYARSGDWDRHGYLSGKSAIVHETKLARTTVNASLASGKLLADFPLVSEALGNNDITSDHVNKLIDLSQDKYHEFFVNDCELLINTAKNVTAEQFTHVTRHWKSMVDAILDEPTTEYEAFEKRHLFLNELFDGSWLIHGTLDPVTGKILKKALAGISQKLWNAAPNENREHYSPGQQRADAIGYLAQSWVSNPSITSSSLLNTDVVITASDIAPGTTTRGFLSQCNASNAPLVSGHSKKFIEQLLCDSSLQAPVANGTGFDLGRKVRTAPWHMKKQLMLTSPTCSVPGCSTPSQWCDAHHIEHWAHGGKTNLENLALLCRRHHTMIHNDKAFEHQVAMSLKRKSRVHPKQLINSS